MRRPLEVALLERLGISPPLPPMEARLAEELPAGEGWRYEPKWDGFRCLVFRDGDDVRLQSKSGKPLGRYFPEVVKNMRELGADRFVIDGELVISIAGALSFEALQLRLHPAESRVLRLAAETPAQLMLFDLLFHKETNYLQSPLWRRRQTLELLELGDARDRVMLSPFTEDRDTACRWLDQVGASLDGVVSKRRDGAYEPGQRAMVKVKKMRTADCVVGGFRYGTDSREVGSLLLGLYNDRGLLDHVGFTSAIPASEKAPLTARLEALIGPPGFTGDSPGGPSRWSTKRTTEWEPLRHELVVEVRYDHVTGHRFRHGTRFLRWRPDKAPTQCRMDQLQSEACPETLQDQLASA
ncbi:MAG TPA: ATP-dependent DNA ligase [Allosphingosinicella sp.]|nr:ATP-dependent DNA ligase [Allosphingosinicella sp.]